MALTPGELAEKKAMEATLKQAWTHVFDGVQNANNANHYMLALGAAFEHWIQTSFDEDHRPQVRALLPSLVQTLDGVFERFHAAIETEK